MGLSKQPHGMVETKEVNENGSSFLAQAVINSRCVSSGRPVGVGILIFGIVKHGCRTLQQRYCTLKPINALSRASQCSLFVEVKEVAATYVFQPLLVEPSRLEVARHNRAEDVV